MLFFGDDPLDERIVTFRAAVNLPELVFSAIWGLAFAVALPWLNLLGAMLVAKPVNKRGEYADIWATNRTQKKIAHAEKKLEEAKVEQAVAEAKRKKEGLEQELIQYQERIDADKKRIIEKSERSRDQRVEEIQAELRSQIRQEKEAAEQHKNILEQEVRQAAAAAEQQRASVKAKLDREIEVISRHAEQERTKILHMQAELEERRLALEKQFSVGIPYDLILQSLNYTDIELIKAAHTYGNFEMRMGEEWGVIVDLSSEEKIAMISFERVSQSISKLTDAYIIEAIDGSNFRYRLTKLGSAVAERF